MSTSLDAYATDEDVALLAADDLGVSFPADQEVVGGIDGSFGPSNRWALQSASVNFQAAGLKPGHVVRLIGPPDRFRAPGVAFAVSAVSAVSGASATLRRLGLEAGFGSPPAPASGLSGIEFVATTLGPQLSRASRELDRLLGLAPVAPAVGEGYDAEALRDAVIRLVLARRFATLARERDDAFAARAALFRAEFDALALRLSVVGSTPGPVRAPRPGTRLIR